MNSGGSAPGKDGKMEEKMFTMSMYLNKEELYKAKAEYYEELYKKSLTTQKEPVAKLQFSDGLSGLVATWENRLAVLKASIDDAGKDNDFRAGLMWQYHHQSLTMCLAELKTAMAR